MEKKQITNSTTVHTEELRHDNTNTYDYFRQMEIKNDNKNQNGTSE